jgi:hypothetical protein
MCSTLSFLLLFVFQVYGLNQAYAAYLWGVLNSETPLQFLKCQTLIKRYIL